LNGNFVDDGDNTLPGDVTGTGNNDEGQVAQDEPAEVLDQLATFENNEEVNPDDTESDPMTDASLVGAESLEDEVSKVQEPKTDDAAASDAEAGKGDEKKDDEKSEEPGVKVVANEDGELFLQTAGASSLAASALAVIAMSSIIY